MLLSYFEEQMLDVILPYSNKPMMLKINMKAVNTYEPNKIEPITKAINTVPLKLRVIRFFKIIGLVN